MYYICNMKKEKIVTIRISEEEYGILVNYPLAKAEGASGFSECANDVGLISSPPL